MFARASQEPSGRTHPRWAQPRSGLAEMRSRPTSPDWVVPLFLSIPPSGVLPPSLFLSFFLLNSLYRSLRSLRSFTFFLLSKFHLLLVTTFLFISRNTQPGLSVPSLRASKRTTFLRQTSYNPSALRARRLTVLRSALKYPTTFWSFTYLV